MKLSTSLVAIKKIISSKPRSLFAEEKLEQAAELILESEGVINPIVVRRTSLQSYEVADGDFEYYAASRAREIDPRKGEMIGVFIIEDENEETLTKQVEVFRKPKDNIPVITEWNSKDIEKFLINLESRFEKITKQLLEQATTHVQLENKVKSLEQKLADKVEPLEVFRKFDKLNIASRLINVGIPEKRASMIAEVVENERSKEQFKSLNDVVERVKISHGKSMQRGISSNKMLDIVDLWSKR
ncbi:ParB N-terminal domain-containing protein [Halotia branconii]|uniref:ParB-like N-terminal domain-containing protein n=1 Tax=Halotia branconii CENA392 TaxID=1539056 RepID=A0AAJ6NUF4_9CYAN|nr:ParB N-terminal domain-containing protein [Halotia branconii]WGV26613.1 hypothetical protein QI031_03630 [Halotia branconii CENA392]